jgi:DNA (cytosine-5)-methyltransferase 1
MTAPTARPAAPPTQRPTVGSLFSGIGGLELGLERAGWEVRWQVEVDDYCRRVLAKHWPDVPKFGDIRTVTGGALERVDLICGGFPCQDISVAGRRAGIDGERSGLWTEYARLVRLLRPRYVLVENVTNLLVRGLDRVLGDLAALGFDAEWECLSAASLGAPHIRDRVFILAYAHGPKRWPLTQGRHGADGQDAGWQEAPGGPRPRGADGGAGPVADPNGLGHRAQAYALCTGRDAPEPSRWWDREPGVERVVDGVPAGVDRGRGLGNAVVPQVAEWLGRRLLETMA